MKTVANSIIVTLMLTGVSLVTTINVPADQATIQAAIDVVY